MLRIRLVILLLMFTLMVSAQIDKSINVATAGTLNTVITVSEKATITDLIISGNIDARDFKYMRDEMAVLATVDISSASIKAYSGGEGTYFDGSFSYPANEIPNGAFSPKPMDGIPRGKATLINVKMPVSTTSIGEIAFASCKGLTGNLIIPNSVTIIKEAAFADCSGFNGTLTLSAQLTTIEKSAFQNCTGFVGSLNIPTNVTSVGESAFMFCSGFDGSLSFGNSLTEIGFFAFSYCSNFSDLLIIPNGIAIMEDNTFEECNNITEVVIPNSVISMGDNVFSNCSRIIKMTVSNEIPPQISSSTFDGVPKNTCVVTVPTGCSSAYKSANYWKDFSVINDMKNTGLQNTNAEVIFKTNHNDKEIIIEGLSKNKNVILYNSVGKIIYKIKSSDDKIFFKLKTNGVYILKVDEKAVKISL